MEDMSAMHMPDVLAGAPGAWPNGDHASQYFGGAAQYGAPAQGLNPATLAMWQQAFARMGGAGGAGAPSMADDPGMYSLHALQQQQHIQQSQMQLQRRACMPRCAAHVYIAHFIDYQQKLAQQILFSQQYQYAINMYANKAGYPAGPGAPQVGRHKDDGPGEETLHYICAPPVPPVVIPCPPSLFRRLPN